MHCYIQSLQCSYTTHARIVEYISVLCSIQYLNAQQINLCSHKLIGVLLHFRPFYSLPPPIHRYLCHHLFIHFNFNDLFENCENKTMHFDFEVRTMNNSSTDFQNMNNSSIAFDLLHFSRSILKSYFKTKQLS